MTIEGPPQVVISLLPYDVGNPCSRHQYVLFTWSEPVDFLNFLILKESTLFSGNDPASLLLVSDTFPMNPSLNDVTIFTTGIDSPTWGSNVYRDVYDENDLRGTLVGDVAIWDGSKWIFQGNLFRMPSLDSIVTPFTNNLHDVTSFPPSGTTEDKDVGVVINDISGIDEGDLIKNSGEYVTDLVIGEIIQYNGEKWVLKGRIADNPIYVFLGDESKFEFISGTIKSDNNLIWYIEGNIIDNNNIGNFTLQVEPQKGYGQLSKTYGPSTVVSIEDTREKLFYDFSDCVYPEVDIFVDEDTGISNFEIETPYNPGDVFIYNGKIYKVLMYIINTNNLSVSRLESDGDIVEINKVYYQDKYEILFIWSEIINDFTTDDIEVTLTDEDGNTVIYSSLDSTLKSVEDTVDENSNIYSIILDLPPNATGTAKITVKSNSVTGSTNNGPVSDTSITIDYNTILPTMCEVRDMASSIGGALVVDTTGEIDLEDNDYLNNVLNQETGDAGGLFNGIFESIVIGNYHYMLVQIMKQSYGYLRPNLQAGAAIIRYNITQRSSDWELVKAYSDITIAARSFNNISSKLYFIEGSHYAYLPGNVFSDLDFSAPIAVDLTKLINIDVAVRSGLPIRWDEFDATDLWTYDTYLRYNNITEYASSIEFNINNAFEISIKSSVIRARVRNKLIQFMYRPFDEDDERGDRPTTNEIISYVKRILEVRTVNRDSNIWRQKIGQLNELDPSLPVDNQIKVLGQTWQSASTEDNPDHDDENPDYFYGIHGGTASPIFINDDNEIHYISGYGNLRDNLIRNVTIEQVHLALNNIENWNWCQYSDQLNHKIPLLLTNEKSPYDILNDIAKMTNSIFGFDGDTFFMKPRDPRKANLQDTNEYNISSTQTGTISIKSGSQNWIVNDYPSHGLILIEDELITYGNTSNGYAPDNLRGGITRGVHDTTAAQHGGGVRILWIDHYISLKQQVIQGTIQKLNAVSQSEHIYNHIKVTYGDGKLYEAKDESDEAIDYIGSIERNGRKILDVDVPLIDSHQSEWAKWIGDSYLKRFKDIHHIIDLQLPTTIYMNLGDIVFIDQVDRAFLSTACQVLDITQNPSDQTTTIKMVTV